MTWQNEKVRADRFCFCHKFDRCDGLFEAQQWAGVGPSGTLLLEVLDKAGAGVRQFARRSMAAVSQECLNAFLHIRMVLGSKVAAVY